MKIHALNRRTVLRGMLATGAAVTIPLPLLDAMLNQNGTALAQDNSALKPLYVTWFFGNGSLPGLWKPAATGAGTEWKLSHQLEPLADNKAYLTVLSGLEGKVVAAGSEHPTGSSGCTTAAGMSGNAVRQPSIDQLIADVISPGAAFRSLEVGVTPATPNGNADSLHTVAHKGPSARLNPQFDPQVVFDRLFKDAAQPTPSPSMPDAAAKQAKVKKSVLDAILQDGESLGKRLGAADKHRVDEHLTSIRSIENRLDTTSSVALPAACGTAKAPTSGKDTKSEAPPAVNTAMAQLTTLALACDRTRVVSFMFSLPAAHVYYRHLASNMNDDFHDTICHTDAGSTSDQPRVDTGVLYAMRSLNELLTMMRTTAHGAGNLLDATLMYVTSDTAWGKVHDPKEWPVLLVGKANGRLKGDEHRNFPKESLSRAILTVGKLMGYAKDQIGQDVGLATDVLPGIGV